MTDSNTQAVAPEAEAVAAPPAEATSAQDTTQSMDELLREFETTTAKPQPAPEAVKPAAVDPVADVRRELAELKVQKQLDAVLTRIRGDVPEDVLSNEELLDLLDGKAKRDPRIRDAFQRYIEKSDTTSWSKLEKALKAEIGKKFQPRTDANATADRDAVAAAVRGTSTKAPDEKQPAYGAMSNSDFQKELAKHGVN